MKKIFITTLALGLASPLLVAGAQESSSARDKMSETAKDEKKSAEKTWSSEKDKMTKSDKSHYRMGKDSPQVVSRQDLKEKDTLDSILNKDVVDQAGESIGTISDLVLEDGEITEALVAIGGVFGIGADTVRIPFEALEMSRTDDEVQFTLGVDAEQFTNEVKADNATTVQIGDDHQAEIVSNRDAETRPTAKKTLSADLVDQAGQTIGKINSIAFEESEVTDAYLELNRKSGGSSDQLVAVPFASLQSVQTDGKQRYRLNTPVEELTSALGQAKDEMARTTEAMTRTGEPEMAYATGMTQTGESTKTSSAKWSASAKDDVEMVQEQIDLILSSYELGSGDNSSEVEVEEDGDSLVLTGTVASSDLQRHIIESIRDLSGRNVLDQIQVNASGVAMQ